MPKPHTMAEKHYHFTYSVSESAAELPKDDMWLLNEARRVTAHAYAPYSNFLVGAAASLANGQIITGSNQENASFPAGICAERVLLSAAASLFPHVAVHTIAISYHNLHGNSSQPIAPCGICRQSLMEQEDKTQHPIRLILAGLTGNVYLLPSAGLLLPLAFNSGSLVKSNG
jgi:cytidine deaminase